jgi:hypothetical protein
LFVQFSIEVFSVASVTGLPLSTRIEEGSPSLLFPLERINLNHWTSGRSPMKVKKESETIPVTGRGGP